MWGFNEFQQNGFTPFYDDRSRSDRVVNLYLGSIDPRRVFDSSYEMGNSPASHKFLVNRFYDCYGHRQICHESIFTFSRLVRGRYFSIRDRYEKLFKTIDVIKNPFLTYVDDFKSVETHKHRDTGTHNRHSRDDGNRIDQHGVAVKLSGQNWNENEGYANDRNKNVQENQNKQTSNSVGTDTFTKYNMFADTPQTPSEVSQSTDDTGQGQVDAKDNAAAITFNEGYMTTADRATNNETTTQTNKEAGTGASQTDTTNQSIGGENTHEYSQNTHNTSGLVHGTTQHQSMNNYRDETGGQSIQKNGSHREGFNGKSSSQLLQEYRETLIMMTGDFLREFEDLFIHVY